MGEEFTIFGIRVERFDEPDSPINLWVMDANQKWHLVKSEPNASQFVVEAYATSVNATLRAAAKEQADGRDPFNVEMDQLRAKVERLERVRLQNENLIQHQSLKMDQFAAKVERLEERLDARPTEADITQLATKCDRKWQAGMEAAAKVVREHPYCTNQETLAKAIDAAAKEQTDVANQI